MLAAGHGAISGNFYPICFSTLCGVSDEIHQFFVAERQADVMDGLADFAGSILGAMIYMQVNNSQGRRQVTTPPP